jgi:hypothetical protein
VSLPLTLRKTIRRYVIRLQAEDLNSWRGNSARSSFLFHLLAGPEKWNKLCRF